MGVCIGMGTWQEPYITRVIRESTEPGDRHDGEPTMHDAQYDVISVGRAVTEPTHSGAMDTQSKANMMCRAKLRDRPIVRCVCVCRQAETL